MPQAENSCPRRESPVQTFPSNRSDGKTTLSECLPFRGRHLLRLRETRAHEPVLFLLRAADCDKYSGARRPVQISTCSSKPSLRRPHCNLRWDTRPLFAPQYRPNGRLSISADPHRRPQRPLTGRLRVLRRDARRLVDLPARRRQAVQCVPSLFGAPRDSPHAAARELVRDQTALSSSVTSDTLFLASPKSMLVWSA